MESRVRVGILGCASVAKYAIVDAARSVPEVSVAGVASRTAANAKRFALEYSISKHYASYDDLLADPDIDLVYIAVPTRVHGEWVRRALECRKPVLCEKPLASNEREAAGLFATAEAAGVPLIEGFHYRHHPVTRRVLALLEAGTVGRLRSIDTGFEVPAALTPPTHSRLKFEHAGGAAIDPGCYCVNLLRLIAGEEPHAVAAEARLFAPNVDVAMRATLHFPSGCRGTFSTSLDSTESAVRTWLRIDGERGAITLTNPYGPHADPVIHVSSDGKTHVETHDDTMTFVFQLRNVSRALAQGRGHEPTPTDSINNMRTIDRVYEAAGLTHRGATPPLRERSGGPIAAGEE